MARGNADFSAVLPRLVKGDLLPVYLLVGENDYFAHQGLQALRARFDPSVVSTFVGDEPAETIFDQLRTVDLFASRRLVVILRGDLFLRSNLDPLVFYLEHPSSGSALALASAKLDARTRFAKLAGKVGLIVPCENLWPEQVTPWILTRFRDAGKSCDRAVADLLVDRAGTDLSSLQTEIDKLVTFIGERPRVTLAEVQELVGHDRTWQVFALTDAVGRRDPRLALTVLTDLLVAGEPAELILGQLAWQFRRLLSARWLLDQGQSPDQIASTLRLFPRYRQGFLEQVGNFSTHHLVELYQHLGRTDIDFKTGRFPAKLALERFLVRACSGHSVAHSPV